MSELRRLLLTGGQDCPMYDFETANDARLFRQFYYLVSVRVVVSSLIYID